MRVDLHLHSTASDGALAPAALVAAAAGRLDLVALTDHDTVSGVTEAIAAAAGRIEVVAGVELSTTHEGRELHVLGYDIDPLATELVEFSRRAARRRQDRMGHMIGRLAELGVHVAYDEVVGLAGSEANVGRPHLARVMVQHGQVRTFAEAFERFIGDAGPAFFPVQLLDPGAAIGIIHRNGGMAVWAHPPMDLMRSELSTLVALGLDGIEAFRPRSLPSESQELVAAANAHDLFVTGGSDWHGEWSGPIGDFAVGAEQVAHFLDRRGR